MLAKDKLYKEKQANIAKEQAAIKKAQDKLDKERKVLTLNEALVQYENEKPFVEVKKKDGSFVRKDITLGASNGVLVEVKSGINKNDEIKVWNETEGKDAK